MKPQLSSLGGRPGTSTRIGREWIGWNGQTAHPNAPIGGGGPGQFAPLPAGSDDSDLPSPWSPSPLSPIPLDQPANAPKPPNAPPVTAAKSLGSIKKKQSDFVDYDIQAEIVADGSGGVTTGADTSFNRIPSTIPSYETKDGKITKFTGKLVFKGTVKIQTKYAADSKSTSLSCYGRGTTTDDIDQGNITLGFHESCHRADYESYLSSNSLPDPPEMSIGMVPATFDTAAKDFATAVNAYWKAMDSESKQKTDEVGFTLSKADRTGSCYVHQIP